MAGTVEDALDPGAGFKQLAKLRQISCHIAAIRLSLSAEEAVSRGAKG